MKEDKILPQTDLAFSKNSPNFSAIQLNEVFYLSKTCLATMKSQRERQGKKVPSFFSKWSGSSCHDKVLQSYGTKCETRSLVNSVPFLKVRKAQKILIHTSNLFPKLRTPKNMVRSMPIRSRFRASVEKQHGKCAQTLFKFEGHLLYHIY